MRVCGKKLMSLIIDSSHTLLKKYFVVDNLYICVRKIIIMKNLTLIFISIFVSFQMMAGMESHPLNNKHSYQTFKNISLHVDANLVNTIFQDQEGMIWLGTKRGLYSYNGYDLHEYIDEMYPNGNPVFSIVQISADYLCLGTDNGVRWFNLTDRRIEHLSFDAGLSMAVRSLSLFGEYLWVGTRDNGLIRMSLSTGTVEAIGLHDKDETTIYSLEPASDKLFIASYEHFSYYDQKDDTRYIVDLGCSERLMVNSLLWDKGRDYVWVGTEGYLYKYDIRTQKVYRQSFLTGNSFKSLSLDSEDNLLIGTDAGLFVYDFSNGAYTQIVHDSRNSRSLCNNIIWDIICDKNQNVWLATDRGVSLAQTDIGQHYIHLSEIVQSGDGNLFTYMMIDSYGDYWLGGENGLIHINNTAPYQVDWFRQDSDVYPLRHNRIRHIYEDSSNDIWIASDGGVGRYDRRNSKFVFYQIQIATSGKNANWAYSILEDRLGRLWIASYMGGLFICNKDNLEILYHFDEDSGIGPNVYLMQDGGDYIWANTSNGLVSIDIKTQDVKRHEIYADNMLYHNNVIWYSILGRLYQYDTIKEENTNIPFSETCRQIHSLILENDNVWVTSSEGIFCIDTATSSFTNISSTTDNYLCGTYDRRSKEIILGGEDCLTRIDIGRNKQGESSDSVFIASLVSGGNLMMPNEDYREADSRIKLNNESDIVIELSSFSYQADETFYYRFGNEEKWQSLGKGNNHISLVNLSGGTYSLQLSNSNPSVNPNALVNEYYITVPHPWYLRWPAFAIYAIVFIGLITISIRIIHLRNRRKFELREKERSLELSNMKMDFFVNISHELKTPLSLIIAPVSRMLSETKNARQRETLSTIHNNALRLNTLIHKVLDFKQLEVEGEDILIRSHTELGTLLNNCINTFKSAIEEKRISINIHAPNEMIWANIDALKLESAIINILSNAIKYVSEDCGVVNIELSKINNNAVISISDNGRGIDKEELSLVFIRYFQGRNGKHQEGNGIGLYLVKKYIELHGGHISIESGNGTNVRLSIPLTDDNSCLVNDTENDTFRSVGDISARVLIIDDNKEIVAFLAETLSQHYECHKAYNGREGLDVIDNYTPDLIIVDQMMPEMDGFTFSRAIRKNFKTSTIPIIMLTAKEDMATEMESIKVGVDIFMPKPFDIKKLQLRIAQLLRKRSSIEKAVRIETTSKPDFKDCRDLQSPDEVFMEKVTKAIEENMGKEDFNVSALAGIVSVDNKQLYRKLKQLTGSTPVNYIRKLRMRKASILLEEDRFTVSEVMFMVGYSNPSYFSKCFAEEFGMSPKDYRKRIES